MTTPAPDPEKTARMQSDALHTPRSRKGDAQFAPGTIVAGRYRIAGILGSGGMGEVYRADDIKLDQTVALKFLPARLERDAVLLARLHDEVRLGRQIAHPNVCRIYDIVEWEGAHFVAMEYVDGEDLSRLLRRIGRLAHDKAVDIARGIAAGLHAAHAKGILHRDLKPANVMIDSHGEPRVMDFGLALAAGEDDGTISGTPAYMAPEQLKGQPATVQSDLYALGLVMYELFTGRRAHSGRTLPERARESSSEITTPSDFIRDIDPAVERVILRCLADEPSQRPGSMREVVQALPGGDPLAAALAAGETPSPRVVAAAGAEGSLSHVAAWSLLAAVVVFLALFTVTRRELAVTKYMPEPRSPQVLRDRAEEMLRAFGVPAVGEPIQSFFRQNAYLIWLEKHNAHRALRHGNPPYVMELDYGAGIEESGVTGRWGTRRGRTSIEIDPQGRLFFILATPQGEWKPRAIDWAALHEAAGLDAASMRAVPPRGAPPVPFDTHMAWTGRYRGDATTIRVEAASWRGTPTYFEITGEWNDVADPFRGVAFADRNFWGFVTVIMLIAVAGALVLAWRNIRLRRGDRQSALRVAAVMFGLEMLGALLVEFRLEGRGTFELVRRAVSYGLFFGAMAYVFYIALEPIVRRRWPSLLISWTRLVGGRWRDPMVGRDVLVGLAAGTLITTIPYIANIVLQKEQLQLSALDPLESVRSMLAHVLFSTSVSMGTGFMGVLILALLTMLLRRQKLAAGMFAVLVTALFVIATAEEVGLIPFVLVIAGLISFVTLRYGLLAIIVEQLMWGLLVGVPALTAPWATPLIAIPFAIVALLALWSFRTSLGGQSLLGEGALAD